MTALLITLGVIALVLWATTRYYGQRPDTYAELTVKMAAGIDEMKRVIGEQLEPALTAAAVSMRDFADAWGDLPNDRP